jgi:hypothetical protein
MGFWTKNLCDGCRMLCYFNWHNPLASVFQFLECIKLNMVEECGHFRRRTTQRTFQHHQFNNCMPSQIKPCHKILRGSNRNKVVYFHHVLQIKVEKTSGWGVLGFILVNVFPNPPQATTSNPNPSLPYSHCKFMGMMWIIISHIHSKLQHA